MRNVTCNYRFLSLHVPLNRHRCCCAFLVVPVYQSAIKHIVNRLTLPPSRLGSHAGHKLQPFTLSVCLALLRSCCSLITKVFCAPLSLLTAPACSLPALGGPCFERLLDPGNCTHFPCSPLISVMAPLTYKIVTSERYRLCLACSLLRALGWGWLCSRRRLGGLKRTPRCPLTLCQRLWG